MRLSKLSGSRPGWLPLLIVLVASGCGGGGGDDSATAPQTAPPPSGSTNEAPTIQGAPAGSVLVGQTYTFQPSATDPDGDDLEFSVENLPGWAEFDPSTGRVSGTPASADVATYEGITISVSDGSTSTSLTPFAIEVTDVAAGSASLSWVAPTENSDGSALTDLAGYEVRYGKDQGSLDRSISVNQGISTYVVENLTAGTWYFAVAAVNTAGISSSLSNVASKTIQ